MDIPRTLRVVARLQDSNKEMRVDWDKSSDAPMVHIDPVFSLGMDRKNLPLYEKMLSLALLDQEMRVLGSVNVRARYNEAFYKEWPVTKTIDVHGLLVDLPIEKSGVPSCVCMEFDDRFIMMRNYDEIDLDYWGSLDAGTSVELYIGKTKIFDESGPSVSGSGACTPTGTPSWSWACSASSSEDAEE